PFAGKTVLVVGAATAGVEIAEECARAGVPVVVSARRGVKIAPQRFLGRDLHDYASLFEKIPRFLVRGYCEKRPTLPGTDLGFKRFVKEGSIRVRCGVSHFSGAKAHFADGSSEECDAVVLATGYSFAFPYLPAVARAPVPSAHPIADECESR